MATTMESAAAEAHLLIGIQSPKSAFAVLASNPGVDLESDPSKLARRAAQKSYDLIVLDREMNDAKPNLLSEQSPVLVAPSAMLLAVVRQVMEHPVAAVSVASEIIHLLVTKRDRASEPAAAVPDEWMGTLLSRQRTLGEERALKVRALKASFAARSQMLEDSLSTREVSDLLVKSRQTPHDRVKNKTLLAIDDGSELRFPTWQFDADGPKAVVDGLPEVLRALALGPLAQARWLTRKNAVLDGRTPIEALKDGDRDRVLHEARAVGSEAGSRSG